MKKFAYMLSMVVIVVISLAGSLAALGLSRTAKVTLLAVDDSGQPIADAKVGVGFEGPGGKYTGKNGLTDEDGIFTASGESLGDIQYGADKVGYYSSHYRYNFKSMGAFRWEPWNPTLKVLLRKIENPVPMYAQKPYRSKEIPAVGKDIGFDLIAFDWVAPYGRGVTTDFIFRLERRGVNRTDFDATLTIKFARKFDGIQIYRESRQDGSQFHLPRFAPQDGYQKDLVLREWRTPDDYSVKRNFDFLSDDVNFIFRVRSEEDDNKFKKAMYGKIFGAISFDTVFSKIGTVKFNYYLNPDYTRNLEFDPKRNLFGTLPDLDQVNEP